MMKSPASTGSSPDGRVEAESTVLSSGFAQDVEIEGRTLSYDYITGNTPTVVFLPGYFFSRWRQAKANAMEIFAKRKGQAILVEEYLGVGKSSGDFAKDGTLSQWISDTCKLIDRVSGKVVLAGAGVGGWIMLHVAMKRPDKVAGIVGVNPSVDFTHDLIIPSMTKEQMDSLNSEGIVEIPWGYRYYPISKALLSDAEQWLVLRGGDASLNISCPVRFLQGLNDEEIPPDRILKLVNAIKSDDCVVSFVKLGDHFLEDESDMQRMWDAICELTDNYYEYDLRTPGSG